jgi:hypothetical protein
MNLILKKLYQQACRGPWDKDDQGSFDPEKFAELIVIECARFDSELLNEDHVDGQTYNWPLLEYFGVKPNDT